MRMTEKEAIRLINAYLEIDYSKIPEMTVEKFDEAMTMMMESFEKNQWIPVTEKLPDDQGMVLVSCRNKKGLNSINRAYYWNGYWHGSGSMSGVKAWKPLPKVYGGE